MDLIILILQFTLISAVPLIIVALGGMFSEKSGVVNIALEGLMVFGAFFGILALRMFQENGMTGNLIFLLALLISGLAGALLSIVHAYASVSLNSDQVISGTAINLFAPAFTILMAKVLTTTQQLSFGADFYVQKVPLLGSIPLIGDVLFQRIYITHYIMVLIVCISYFVMFKTRFGLRLRSCGENPQASASVGINVKKIRYLGVVISGFLAGIGGLTFIVTIAGEFNSSVSGFGFLALAVLIFGQWHPIKIVYAALVFGLFRALGVIYTNINILNALNLSKEIYDLLPYAITLVVLAYTSKNSQAPKAAGEPYDKSKR